MRTYATVLATVALCSTLCTTALGQECAITEFTSSGSLSWSNSQAGLYCGVQYVESLGQTWEAAPPPDYWNIFVTGVTHTVQIPTAEIEENTLFLRVLCSTNTLSGPYVQVDIPWGNIVVDGSRSDWGGVAPAVTDIVGDAVSPAGSDIEAIYIARDNANVYVRIDLANGPPSSTLYFGVSFYPAPYSDAGDRFVFINMGTFECSVEERIAAGSVYHNFVAAGALATSSDTIETSVPFGALNPPSPSYVEGWNDTNGPAIDLTSTVEATFPDHYTVPSATIVLDGNSNDWFGIAPAITDVVGDATSPSGSDIEAIYIARDTSNVFVRVDVANGAPSADLYFGVSFYPQPTFDAGDRFVFIDMPSSSCSVEERIEAGSVYHNWVTSGTMVINGSIIETAVPLMSLSPPSRSYVQGWNDTNGPPIDVTDMIDIGFP